MKLLKNVNRNRLSVGVASAMLLCAATAMAESSVFKIDIKAKKAGESLLELGKKTGVQIMVPHNLGKAINLPRLTGEYTLTSALDKLLDGTGLKYEVLSDDAILVEREDEGAEKDVQKKDVEELVVTGSRIRNSKPTSHVKVLTRDELDRMGVNTAADIVASLPQNNNNVNLASTTINGGENDTPYGTLGEAAANLRGVGSEGTLVLVDGRRMASSPGFSADGRVNLGTIPAAAIERVEILLDGASAIYGSDAIGGVINFILKKDYIGALTKVRYEDSVNNADNFTLTQTLGYSWDSGSVLATMSYGETDGASTYKAGWYTNDFRYLGGRDRRAISGGRYSSIYGLRDSSDDPWDWVDGVIDQDAYENSSWDKSDLILFDYYSEEDREALGLYYDEPALGLEGTPTSKSKSVTLKVEQQLTDSLEVYANALWSSSENHADRGPFRTTFVVPTTNPFNKFGKEAYVAKNFLNEFREQGMRGNSQTNNYKRVSYDVGFKFDAGFKDWLIDVNYGYGEEQGQYSSWSMSTYSENEALASAVAGIQMKFISSGKYEPVLDGDGETISVPALNLFGDGSDHDPDLDLNSLVIDSAGRGPATVNEYFDISADGELFDISGGTVRMAINLNHREEHLDWSKAKWLVGLRSSTSDDMAREVFGFGAELSVPLVGEANNFPMVDSLILSLAGRYEDYRFEGYFYGDDKPLAKKSFDSVNPRLGIAWGVTPEVTIRGSWGESFRAPPLEWLHAEVKETERTIYDYYHPNPESVPGAEYFPNGDYWLVKTENVRTLSGGNPDLKPETATNTNFSVTYEPEYLEGFKVTATLSSIEWANRLTRLYWGSLEVRENPELFPELVVRDPDTGLVTFAASKPVNGWSRKNKSLDLDVSYQMETDIGFFDFNIYAVETLKQYDQTVPTIAPKDRVGLLTGTDRFKIRAKAGWSGDNKGVTLYANWRSGYHLTDYYENKISDKWMPHATTYDLTAYLDIPEYSTKVNFGVKNVLNKSWDFMDYFRGPWDSRRFDPRGRMVYMEVSKDFEI
ncbi:TonB-dependent receptor [Porticoccaceae bacterium LTM1]|nr:TonB-dependent receptor [Porticoccaceae bacterium LTM1]